MHSLEVEGRGVFVRRWWRPLVFIEEKKKREGRKKRGSEGSLEASNWKQLGCVLLAAVQPYFSNLFFQIENNFLLPRFFYRRDYIHRDAILCTVKVQFAGAIYLFFSNRWITPRLFMKNNFLNFFCVYLLLKN